MAVANFDSIITNMDSLEANENVLESINEDRVFAFVSTLLLAPSNAVSSLDKSNSKTQTFEGGYVVSMQKSNAEGPDNKKGSFFIKVSKGSSDIELCYVYWKDEYVVSDKWFAEDIDDDAKKLFANIEDCALKMYNKFIKEARTA